MDTLAGEQCDPLAPPEEFQCPLRGTQTVSGCDVDTCACRFCGDGVKDSSEQCDGADFGGATCDNGDEDLLCTDECKIDRSRCSPCGNGRIDPGEECDDGRNGDNDDGCTDLCMRPSCGDGFVQTSRGEECDPSEVGGFGQVIECTELDSSPLPKPYAGGQSNGFCQSDCRYDRSGCNFCGDGFLDGARGNGDVTTIGELCDGDIGIEDEIVSYCRRRCTGSSLGSLVLDCNFDCGDRCQTFVDVSEDELDCCIPTAEPCPADGSRFQCCWALIPGNDPADACEESFGGQELGQYCK